MVDLTDNERRDVWRILMQRGDVPGTILKTDFRAAVDAMDNFLDDNAATINSALPLPYRTAATNPQKAALLAAVALKRYGGRDL